MKEDLLQFIWKFKLLNQQNLTTLDGEQLEVISSGLENNADGPDFLNARVKIGSQVWAGNVEIHVNSTDWIKHKHSTNPKFKNLILHVVYKHDVEIEELTFQKTPTLELTGKLNNELLSRYLELMSSQLWVPCANRISEVSELNIKLWLQRLLVERLERRTQFIDSILEENQYDWNQAFMEVLFRSFGFKKNADTMQLLANKIGYQALKSELETDDYSLDALIIGSSGFLPETANHFYIVSLIQRFQFQKAKYKIEPLKAAQWIKGGVRPGNQPFTRLIQLLSFLKSIDFPFLNLFGSPIKEKDIENHCTKPSGYWSSHTKIEHPSIQGVSKIGKVSMQSVLINGILPFQFYYARYTKNEALADNVLETFSDLKSEENSIITKWKSLGLKSNNAFDSQALLELKNNYCSEKKCLICAIGNQILKR